MVGNSLPDAVITQISTAYQTFGTDKTPSVAVGFDSDLSHTAWIGISDAALILFALYQGAFFVLVSIRLFKVWTAQHEVEVGGGASQRTYRTRGLGWIAAAFLIGAIEAIVGFVQGTFAVVMTRRLLHLFSRSFLVVGLLLGCGNFIRCWGSL
jgi:hypothetical protein